MDLKAYKEDPYIYSCENVIDVIYINASFINKNTGGQEDTLEVLYCGCQELKALKSGESLPIYCRSSWYNVQRLEEYLVIQMC